MATCETCKANKVCDHNKYGFENCNNYISADVVDVTKVVETLCKIKTNIIKNVCTMIENDFSEIVKDALGERSDT